MGRGGGSEGVGEWVVGCWVQQLWVRQVSWVLKTFGQQCGASLGGFLWLAITGFVSGMVSG